MKMKNYFKTIFLFLIAVGSTNLQAQKSVTLAVDPLTIIALGGFEVELGVNINKSRITASYLSGDLSPWFGQAADFSSGIHSVLEVAYSRFLNDQQKGFSYGLAYAYYLDFTVENAQEQTLEKYPSRISAKLAYAWFPFKKFPLYIEPSMTFGFMLDDEDLNFTSGEVFDKKTFIGNGPLFNVGYKFNF